VIIPYYKNLVTAKKGSLNGNTKTRHETHSLSCCSLGAAAIQTELASSCLSITLLLQMQDSVSSAEYHHLPTTATLPSNLLHLHHRLRLHLLLLLRLSTAAPGSSAAQSRSPRCVCPSSFIVEWLLGQQLNMKQNIGSGKLMPSRRWGLCGTVAFQPPILMNILNLISVEFLVMCKF
jgi:hypothetical protein